MPKNLSDAVVRCLAKDPEERFQGGEELADALTDSLAVRQKVPAPIRMFADGNKEATTLVVAMSLAGLAALWFAFVEGDSPALLLLASVAAVPFAVLARMARRLLRSGYGYEELVQALKSDVEERRQGVESEYRDPSRLNVWAGRGLIGSGAIFLACVASLPFVPFGWWDPVLGALGASTITGSLSILGLLATHEVAGGVPGERWLKFWESPLGRGIFKLSKFRLGKVASTGAAYGHTEMAIGMAADRLFDGLPKDVQKSFSELPDVVRTLEQDADGMRSRIEELDALLAQIESEEALGKSGRVAASPGVADMRDSLADDLRNARDAADARLSEVVVALETIRLELLRMHAGAGSVESMTADLSSARELSQDIGRVIEGAREVEKLLESPSSSA